MPAQPPDARTAAPRAGRSTRRADSSPDATGSNATSRFSHVRRMRLPLTAAPALLFSRASADDGARIGRGVLLDAFLEPCGGAVPRCMNGDGGNARQDQQKAGGRQLIGYAARHLHASSIVAAHARSTPA